MGGMRRVFIHLGNPKTATTSLQDSIFPYFSGISYNGKSSSSEIDITLWEFLRNCWDSFSTGDECVDCISEWTSKVVDSGLANILISDEDFMAWRSPRSIKSSRWMVENNPKLDIARSGSHPINEFLSLIIERLPAGIELRGILTLRNHADYLGSFAAEMGFHNPRSLDAGLRTSDASLQYFGIVRDLQKTLGKQNLLLLFYEDGLAHNFKRITEFIGTDERNSPISGAHSLNVKRIKDGVWITGPREPRIVINIARQLNSSPFGRLIIDAVWKIAPWFQRLIPKVRRKIVISEWQRQKIRSNFKNDTKKLSREIGRNLEDLGY